MIIAALFGVKRDNEDKYNTDQLAAAGWTLLFGIPIILLLFPTFPIPLWAMIVASCLMLINMDEALMLFYLFSEHGVKAVADSGDYSQWIQELYYSPISQSDS